MGEKKDIILSDMGSMMFGGIYKPNNEGKNAHFDHGYAQYFVPKYASNYPVIFWHGNGQTGRCWESTADGRDGFWQIFTRRNIPVYIVDQPRRGRASMVEEPEAAVSTRNVSYESDSWTTFRTGVWTPEKGASIFPNSQVPDSPYAIDQFERMRVLNCGADPTTKEHICLMGDAMKDLLEQAGPSILFTHSRAGMYTWQTGIVASDNLKALFSYEPGNVIFPDDYEIEYWDSPLGTEASMAMRPFVAPKEEWLNLTKIPIRIYYGDYITEEPSDIFGVEVWRFGMRWAQQFVDLINEYGGDAKLTHLPKIGITGNTHNAMGELNNVEVADLFEKDMRELGLLENDHPYRGPVRKTMTEYTVPLNIEK